MLPPNSSQISRKKRGAAETTRQNGEHFLSFFLPSPVSSAPRFCRVTDGFNYLLTLRTQQIHVINWAGDCCGHRLDEEEEREEEE